MDAWLAFARSGDPSSTHVGRWPEYGADRATMLFGETCRLEHGPYDAERAAWDAVPQHLLGSI